MCILYFDRDWFTPPPSPPQSCETFPNVATCCLFWKMQPSYNQPPPSSLPPPLPPQLLPAPSCSQNDGGVPLCIYTDSHGASAWRKGQWRNHSSLEKQWALGCVRYFMHSILQTDQVSILLALCLSAMWGPL